MATTRISKMKVKQGNFADLPLLDAGEFGYAKDQRRLFIGNDTIAVGTGNGSTTAFVLPVDFSNHNVIGVYLNGSITSAYTISGTTITFNTAPGSGVAITAKFNGELDFLNDIVTPSSIQLAANGVSADTGFSFNTTVADTCIIDYTLKTANGLRVGQLRIAVNTTGPTAAIDDNYTEVGAVDIAFGTNVATANTLKLTYTDNAGAVAKFKYTYQLWNSN